MRNPLLRLLPVLALMVAGCAANRLPEHSAAMHSDSAENSPWAFFLDTGDSGDDPWTPGCHYKCTDADCAGETRFWGGDFCSGSDLQEWTNSGPHAAESDIVRHDCDAACKEKGAPGGRCVVEVDACAGTFQSSRCHCENARKESDE